ncbi:MAG: tRNA lysidine(34) synthetase TilS [Kosmotoga sp.]|nr:MAG: tRNA lysidine(34) synthetase TilS [Kosmotoga sp.]
MHKLEQETINFIEEWGLVKKGDRLLLAVSGGKDSMAMLDFFIKHHRELGCEIHVANLDHMLRGNKGLDESKMIKAICEVHNIPFYFEQINVRNFMKKNQNLSPEEAARIIRRVFLLRTKEEFGLDKIATAHHLNDLAENIILRIVRGTGLKGILGLKPIKDCFIRPFLKLKVQEIEDYVTINMINFKTDKSNYLKVFDRNFVRLKVMPLLKELNPSVEDSIWRFFLNVKESYDYIYERVKEVINNIHWEKDRAVGNLEDLKNLDDIVLSETIRSIITYLSKNDYPPTRERIKVVVEQIKAFKNNWIIEFKDYLRIFGYGGQVFFYKEPFIRTNEDYSVDEIPFCRKIPGGFIKITERNDWPDKIDGKHISVCSKDCLVFPLKLRNMRWDDEIVPFGKTSQEKVRRILVESGFKGFFDEQYVLVNGDDEILWVPGIKSSQRCFVKKSSEKVLVLAFERR